MLARRLAATFTCALALVFACVALPSNAFAATTYSEIQAGTSALVNPVVTWEGMEAGTKPYWTYVYYGNYLGVPIEWMVSSLSGGNSTSDEPATFTDTSGIAVSSSKAMFLTATYLFDTENFGTIHDSDGTTYYYGDVQFNADSTAANSGVYQGSDLQAWCNGFLSWGFETGEAAYILKTTKAEVTKSFSSSSNYTWYYGTYKMGELAGDSIFPLSMSEITNTDLGLGSLLYQYPWALQNAYSWANESMHVYWLRSCYAEPDSEYDSEYANYAGFPATVFSISGNNYGGNVRPIWKSSCYWSVVPALNINTDAILFTFENRAKFINGTGVSGEIGDDKPIDEGETIKALAFNEPSTYRSVSLTLYDESRANFSVKVKSQTEDKVTVSYSGAQTGANEYISILIKDNTSGSYTYYGRVKNLTAESDATGEAVIDLAKTGDMTGKTLYVFNEQLNSAKDATEYTANTYQVYETDYASKLTSITFGSASVTVEKDDAVWTDSGKTIQLKNDNLTRTLTDSDSDGTFGADWVVESILSDTTTAVSVYAGDLDSKQTVSNTVTSATVDYYTVSYDLNGGGSGSAPADEIVLKGYTATEPTDPTPASGSSGAFGGWYKEAACTNAWTFATDTVSTTTTLYAKWETAGHADATVTFKIVGGTWSDGSSTDKTVTVSWDDTANGGSGGYKLDTSQIPTGMTASTGYSQASGAWDADPATTTFTETSKTFTYTFEKTYTLPNTGGPGSEWYTWVGVALIGTSALWYVGKTQRQRRKKRA